MPQDLLLRHGETRRRNKRSCGKSILRAMYARDTLEQAPWYMSLARSVQTIKYVLSVVAVRLHESTSI